VVIATAATLEVAAAVKPISVLEREMNL
jgi:hypothetical protein